MIAKLDRNILYFILVLGIIAVSLWTIFLVKLFQIAEDTNTSQQAHINGSTEARDNVLSSKHFSELNVNMTKTNSKNIENILNNITEINNKISSSSK